MLRSILAILAMTVGTVASASDITTLMTETSSRIVADATTQGISFKVGDTASYSLNLGAAIKGSMVMTVKAIDANALVITQDMDLGFVGKQNCEVTLNPNTGAMIKTVCNGQEQKPTDQGSLTVEVEKEDKITVPAGTFDCFYIKAKNNKDNSEIEQWAAPKLVPVFGMVKMLSPSQLGQVDVELTSFHRN